MFYIKPERFTNTPILLLVEASESLGDFTIFTGIAVFCVGFGLLVMVFRKKLESLTHGAEDNEREVLETETYELADPDIQN